MREFDADQRILSHPLAVGGGHSVGLTILSEGHRQHLIIEHPKVCVARSNKKYFLSDL
ncbi:hypothetical protein [Roseovarius sp.]|uniref:hypothetical protein n=1 Tax=Roseovarius sp. TaxID=1486281 RepID=UPI0032EC8C9B